jgi:ubiquinone biosynthesis protein UbiJ
VSPVKLDAKTITALTGLLAVLLGGAELRMAVNRLDDKAERLEERLARIEREIAPRPMAHNGD